MIQYYKPNRKENMKNGKVESCAKTPGGFVFELPKRDNKDYCVSVPTYRIALEWTKELPKKAGWYWCFWTHPKSKDPHIIYINKNLEFHDALPYDDEGIWRPVTEYLASFPCFWLGPLPTPECPEMR